MIKITDTVIDAIVKLADGNPGAMSVCAALVKNDPTMGFMNLLDLDDMGITGSSIWIGFKDFAQEDIEVFSKALTERDDKMIAKIKANGGQAWKCGRS